MEIPPLMRLFGLETEYGIVREDLADMDPVVESMEVVRAYLAGQFRQTWDYQGEDPHQDARGFRVEGLEQDEEEQAFAQADRARPFTFQEMKSDLVLGNGARLYNDHTHPEYSTAECRRIRDLVAQDRAGERILQHAAEQRNLGLDAHPVQLYKNNTDFHGHSYGCHDNYLVPRTVSLEALTTGLLPFLVSRQLVAGAGKVGIESQDGTYQAGVYQLSQRADFMEAELGVGTMHNRPLINTRDEPHADPARFRRLHLILGDANMCEWATALKVGTTWLVLTMIERGTAPAWRLEAPVQAVKTLSRDPALKATVTLVDGRAVNGIELQWSYLEAARRTLAGEDDDTDWIIRAWEEVLLGLERDRSGLVGRVDWITKQWLLESFMQAETIGWDDPWMASLDLEYHNINPDRGLFLGLEQEGRAARVTTDQEIAAACANGPSDTRGGIRGLCVKRFGGSIEAAQWERIRFKGWITSPVLDMQDLFAEEEIRLLRDTLEQAASPAEAIETWRRIRKS